MSDEEKEALRLVLEALKRIEKQGERHAEKLGADIAEVRQEVSDLRIVVVSHINDEDGRHERNAEELQTIRKRLDRLDGNIPLNGTGQ